MKKETVLSVEGREKLINELQYLETEKRAEIGERIKTAREFGDISENSEYDDAKNEQAWLESRILEINWILSNSTIIENPTKTNKVVIGSQVTVQFPDKKTRDFKLVGSTEADSTNGFISIESPVGAALLGSKKGDAIEVEGPTGKKTKLEVLKIKRA